MRFNEWLNEATAHHSWGYHLILDISGCNNEINEEKEIRKFIKELVKEIDMIAVGQPVLKYLLPGQPNEGYSLMQLIETSSITFHFVKPNKTAYCDIFSCKSFEPKDAIRVVEKYFQPDKIEKCFIQRDAHKGSKIIEGFLTQKV